MPWRPEDRGKREIYEDPEYRRNARICKTRANGRCHRCGKQARALQADHIRPVSQGGTHDLANLQALCQTCHRAKTAREGGGWRKPRGSTDPQPRPTTNW